MATTQFIVIAADMACIYATGASERAAIRDYERQTGCTWGSGSERIVRAAPRLVRAVRKHGGASGDVAWDIKSGVADKRMDPRATVRVWDEVAGHYSIHGVSRWVASKARRLPEGEHMVGRSRVLVSIDEAA